MRVLAILAIPRCQGNPEPLGDSGRYLPRCQGNPEPLGDSGRYLDRAASSYHRYSRWYLESTLVFSYSVTISFVVSPNSSGTHTSVLNRESTQRCLQPANLTKQNQCC